MMNTLKMKKTMTTINHHYQPTGNSCGPTCLYMVMEYLLNKQNDLPFDVEIKYSITDICEMCGTDWIVGTPPDRMEKGMTAMGLTYIEYIGSPRPYELLRHVIDDGNVPIIRTICSGIPHWVIVSQYDDKNNFEVLDPSLGIVIMDEKRIDKIWQPRNYQFFEVKIPSLYDYNLKYEDGNGY